MIIGSAITEDVVRQDPRYVTREIITPSDIGNYTLEQLSVNATSAIEKVNSIKKEYGDGISALIRIYNALGEPLSLVTTYHWEGHVWKYPMDTIIQNGQWSVFLSAHSEWSINGAIGAAIFRANTAKQDVFLGWMSPHFENNSVYVESREIEHWPKVASWDWMYKNKTNAPWRSLSCSDKWEAINVTGQVGQDSSPLFDFVVSRS